MNANHCYNLYTTMPMNAISFPPLNFLRLLFLQERICNFHHAIAGAHERHRSASTHYQAQLTFFVRQLVRVIDISHVLGAFVEHEIDQSVESLQPSLDLSAAGELHAHALIDVLAKVEHSTLLLVIRHSTPRRQWA